MATLLLVDDDRDVRELLRIAFRFDGHTVAEAKDVREGRELTFLLAPDLIVTDHRMGRETGIDFVRQLRQASVDCPVIFWSADREVRQLALAAGASHFFVKGVDTLTQLREAVDQATRPRPLRLVKGA